MTKIYIKRCWILIGLGLCFLMLATTVLGQNTLISLSFKNADLKDVFRALADQSGINLVVDSQLKGQVTVHLSKLSLLEALNIICQNNGLSYTKEAQVYHIFKRDDSKLLIDYQNNLLTVDVRNVPIAALARSLTEKTGISVIVNQDVSQNITAYFEKLPFAAALSALCEMNNLLLVQDEQLWRIGNGDSNARISFKDDLLTIDATNSDAVAVFKEIARQSGVNITLTKEVRGNITIHLQKVALEDGLTAITTAQGWSLERQAKYYLISPGISGGQNNRITYDVRTQKFNLDVQDATLGTIIYDMVRKADLNIVIMVQLNNKVNNLRLRGQTFEQALTFLLGGSNYIFIKKDNSYIIGDGVTIRPENSNFAIVKVYPIKFVKADQLIATLPAIFPKQDFAQLADKNAVIVTAPQTIHDQFSDYLNQVDQAAFEERTEIIKLKNLKAEDVIKNLPQSIAKANLVVIKEQNALAFSGPQEQLKQVRDYLSQIDQVNPMIVFDVRVLQISDTDGLTWNTSGSAAFNLGSRSLALDVSGGTLTLSSDSSTATTLAVLNGLVSTGKAKIIANPTISTLNGCQASFSVSTKENYNVATSTVTDGTTTTTTDTVKTYESGLYLSILPWVSADAQITMEIKPKYSEFGTSSTSSDLPTTYERNTETTLRVKDQQTVIISGLKQTSINKQTSKIPILGDIPLLGMLFRTQTKTATENEFVIVITPNLVFDQAGQAAIKQKIVENYQDVDIKKLADPPVDAGSKSQTENNGTSQIGLPPASINQTESDSASPKTDPTVTE